jgi:hypothetical protein
MKLSNLSSANFPILGVLTHMSSSRRAAITAIAAHNADVVQTALSRPVLMHCAQRHDAE